MVFQITGYLMTFISRLKNLNSFLDIHASYARIVWPFGVLIMTALICGCIQLPIFPDTHHGEISNTPDSGSFSDANLEQENLPPEMITPELTQPPEQTPHPSTVTDWNPYSVMPTPTPPLNHTSILKTDTPHTRMPLNLSYSGSVGLAGLAQGKELNITTGPFSITYTVHPNISSPLDVWAKLTVRDPWQNPVAEGGYNRGYPNQETQTMTVYREGRYYLTIEGDFLSVDYAIRTGDPAPVVTATPPPVNEMADEEFPG